MRKLRGFAGALVLGIVVACGGCGGDGGAAGTPISTSVPGNKPINTLTPAERGQLCADLAAWAMSGPFLTGGCNASAWLATYSEAMRMPSATDADLRTTCGELYAGCVANGVTSMCDQDMPITCTATVSEYNACLVDGVEAFDRVPACSALTRAALAGAVTRLTSGTATPACTAVQTKCPDAN